MKPHRESLFFVGIIFMLAIGCSKDESIEPEQLPQLDNPLADITAVYVGQSYIDSLIRITMVDVCVFHYGYDFRSDTTAATLQIKYLPGDSMLVSINDSSWRIAGNSHCYYSDSIDYSDIYLNLSHGDSIYFRYDLSYYHGDNGSSWGYGHEDTMRAKVFIFSGKKED